MNKAHESRLNNVDDSCNDCGSYADIGAVIDEFDTLLVIDCQGDDAKAQVDSLIKSAQTRFAKVQTQQMAIDGGWQLSLTFAFSAEKMIFQLENHL